jgi:translation initiation factor 2B subunit (eIF-2B alpha/beta/delta family)
MQMVHVRRRQKAMQRRIDRGRRRIIVEGAKRIHSNDIVLALGALVALRQR